MRRLFAFFTLLFLSGLQAQDLQKIIDEACKENQLPSIAAIVFRREGVIEQAVSGVRKMGSPAVATLQDKYHLGSITKSMTASLAAILVEEGNIRWDSSIDEVLGKQIQPIHPSFKHVTLRELCEHRSGMPHDVPPALWKELWQRSAKGDEKENRSWFISELLKSGPAQDKGTFAYSNSGYMCAGLMLETATGKSWQALMRDKLFTPLQMKSAGFGPCAVQAEPIDQPWPHVDGQAMAPGLQADNPAALGPAGTVHCSIIDLARYGAWHLSNGKNRKPTLKEESFALLHESRYYKKHDGGYALGWQQVPRPWAKGNALTHNGTNTMNYAVIWLAPEANLGIAVVCNEGERDVAKALDRITSAMVIKYANKP